VVFTFFGASRFLFNQFGYDRGGFRTLVLLPVPRKNILLGKNLALIPTAIGIGLVFLALIKFGLDVPFIIIIAASLQMLTGFLLLSMAGNLLSILLPYRIAAGSLKPTKIPPTSVFLLAFLQFLFPVLMFPIFFPPLMGLLFSAVGGLPPSAANLLFSIIIFSAVVFLYRLSLTGLGNLLHRREKDILRIVTQEIE
jgi:hypothetical protein